MPELVVERVPAGAFRADSPAAPRLRAPDRPAAAMVLAPVLGLALWAMLVTLVI